MTSGAPSGDDLRALVPRYATALAATLDLVLATDSLTPQQLWGAILACAAASRSAPVTAAAERAPLSPAARDAARTAASVMAMSTVYYRATHLLSDPAYRAMPSGLRLRATARPGVERLDFELWCVAVSAVHGCSECRDVHESTARKFGAERAAVREALRVAGVVHALAVTADASTAARSSDNRYPSEHPTGQAGPHDR